MKGSSLNCGFQELSCCSHYSDSEDETCPWQLRLRGAGELLQQPEVPQCLLHPPLSMATEQSSFPKTFRSRLKGKTRGKEVTSYL